MSILKSLKKIFITTCVLSSIVLTAFNVILLLEMQSGNFKHKTKKLGRDIAYNMEAAWDSFEYKSKRVGKDILHKLENTFEDIDDIFD